MDLRDYKDAAEKEDLSDPSSAAKYRSKLIWVLQKR